MDMRRRANDTTEMIFPSRSLIVSVRFRTEGVKFLKSSSSRPLTYHELEIALPPHHPSDMSDQGKYLPSSPSSLVLTLVVFVDGFRPNADDPSQPLATTLRPLTSATLTVRIIKSFEFRTTKSLVIKEVDLERVTVGRLMEMCREGGCVSGLERWNGGIEM